jgi:hypothetical protein
MKIVNINKAPTVCIKDGAIRPDVISLDAILNHVDDEGSGRNAALRTYVYALRDLQVAHSEWDYTQSLEAIDEGQAKVAKAFDKLIAAEFRLNRNCTADE